MPNKHKSPIKRAKQDQRRKFRNSSYKTRVATVTKRVLDLADDKDKKKTLEEFKKAQSIIDVAATKGILHKNTVARRVSRIARNANKSLNKK